MGQSKILLVDDDAGRHAVADRLRSAGALVVTRAVAIGTAAAIVRERPDLVLWDLTMPLVSDVDVAALRDNPQIPDFTLVVYARRTPAELTALVERSGADGYVEKCDDPDLAARRISPWRTSRRRRKAQSGTERRARYVAFAGGPATHRDLLAVVAADTVVRHTEAGFEALRWMGSPDPPDLMLVGTSLFDLPAHLLARRALDLDERWAERLVIVDERVPLAEGALDGVTQRIWRRTERLDGLVAILDGLRATG